MEEWEIAARAGYPYTSRGEAGIREALGELHRRARQQKNRGDGCGPQYVFGRLYQWLAFSKNNKDAGPIKGIVHDYSINMLRTDFGRSQGAEKAKSPANFSIQTIAKEFGVHPKTLRNLLADQGVIPKGRGVVEPGSFDLQASRRLARMVREIIPQTKLPAYMNATRGQVVMLLETGLLRKVNGKKTEISGLARGVAASDVDAFLKDLHRDAVDVADIPEGMWDIPETAQKSRVTADAIVRMLLAREIKRVVRKRGQTGYRAIRLDPDEVADLYEPRRPKKPLAVTEVARQYGMNSLFLGRLLATGRGAEFFPGGKFSPRSPAEIPPAAAEHFAANYVTLFMLCWETGMHHIELNRRLKRRGVRPVIDPKLIGGTLYRRADIPVDLFD